MAAESGKIDPMHQFEVTPLGGGFNAGMCSGSAVTGGASVTSRSMSWPP